MDANTAKNFAHRSAANAAIVEGSFSCECEAYADIFTYDRWLAQGLVVIKGQKGTKIQTWKVILKENDEGEKVPVGRRPWTSTVFCRHQVQVPDPNHKKAKPSPKNGKAKVKLAPLPKAENNAGSKFTPAEPVTSSTAGDTCPLCLGSGTDDRISASYDQTCYVCHGKGVLPPPVLKPPTTEPTQPKAAKKAKKAAPKAKSPKAPKIAKGDEAITSYVEYGVGPLDAEGEVRKDTDGRAIRGTVSYTAEGITDAFLKERKAYKGRSAIKQLPYLAEGYGGKNSLGGRKCIMRQSKN